MLIAAALAIYHGWQIHTGRSVWVAYGLGVLALALAIWHFARSARNPRERI